MPEMALVSTRECARVRSRPDVYGGSAPNHHSRARSVPSPEMSGRNVSATTEVSTTEVSTTKVPAAKVATAVSATAVSRRSIGGER